MGEGSVALRMHYDESLTRIGRAICGQALMALAYTTMVFVVSSATLAKLAPPREPE